MTIAFPAAGRNTFLRVPETNGRRSPTYLILPWVNQTDTNLRRSGNFLDSEIVTRSRTLGNHCSDRYRYRVPVQVTLYFAEIFQFPTTNSDSTNCSNHENCIHDPFVEPIIGQACCDPHGNFPFSRVVASNKKDRGIIFVQVIFEL